ncbi:MAG: DUF3089 domain-containing protein [Pseudomonadota bacterium]
MKWRVTLFGGLFAVLCVTAALVFFLQDNLVRFLIKPSAPFEVVPTPAPPDYQEQAYWHLWPVNEEPHGAEIFLLHSATYYSPDFWNSPLDDEKSLEETITNALPNEAGPFFLAGRVFVPKVRQATKAAEFTHKYQGMAARKLAFTDAAASFDVFLRSVEEDRPIILVGYGQGADLIAGLLKRGLGSEDATLRKRLAAAYLINTSVDRASFASVDLPICGSKRDVRCGVAFNTFEASNERDAATARRRAISWSNALEPISSAFPELVCVNPVTWKTDDAPSNQGDHLGAASATGLQLKERPPAVPNSVTAQCKDGILVVDPPTQSYLRRQKYLLAKWRVPAFNIFFYDLAENAAIRAAAMSVLMREEARNLGPIEETVEIEDSPIQKVPDNN